MRSDLAIRWFCPQLFYGPLLGRKRPFYAGLSLFAVASLGCIAVRSPGMFIAFRLLQALGGCVAQVGVLAMVRDFFPVRESAKILSVLMASVDEVHVSVSMAPLPWLKPSSPPGMRFFRTVCSFW
jgi:MFS family permease